MSVITNHFGLIGILLGILILAALVRFVFVRSIQYVHNDRVAIVEKLWSRTGSIASGLIALNGEAGFQPEVLRGGYHFFFPFQFRVHTMPLVTVPQGQIGYIFARDGKPLSPTQTLASNVSLADFLDVRAFLHDGGQKGFQRTILREGTYAINLAQFVVVMSDEVHGLMLEDNDTKLFSDTQRMIAERNGFKAVVIKDNNDQIGVVTVHDGPALATDHIIAPTVGTDAADESTFHNSFQNPEKFLAAGGRRGRQMQVLVEGTYMINRLFATVEFVAKTVIPVGFVGVVLSYTGELGIDTTGTSYRHGELVERNSRGVWADPLLPGKYAFNTYAGDITIVPTTNFILKWENETTGNHKLDENLSEVTLITKDAFEPILPLQVVLHIDYKKAPEVIQRFGDVKKLIEQTLDPMVSAYFKNVGQGMTLIELLQKRSEIQDQAGKQMKARFAEYSLEFQEVLIGTPRSSQGDQQIEKILDQLRMRQVAEEQVGTFDKQKISADSEKSLREAQARAAQQAGITQSELSITIEENAGKAAAARAIQQAEVTRTQATAEADQNRIRGEGEASKIISLANAEAERITKTGLATAATISAQSEASGGPQFQLTRQIVERLATALETSKVDIVPRIQMGGNGQGSLIETLMALVASEKGMNLLKEEPAPEKPEAAIVESVE